MRITGKQLRQILILTCIYFISTQLGSELNSENNYIKLICIPSGLGLAALVLFDYPLWPGILLGGFLSNLFIVKTTIPIALVLATGNTFEAVLGTYLLCHFKFRPALERTEDVLKFIILAAILGTLVGSFIEVSGLWFGAIIHEGYDFWSRFEVE
ncbi:MAG: MASE1 domain-containing protein, partial [Bdellovibrionia bacterium]